MSFALDEKVFNEFKEYSCFALSLENSILTVKMNKEKPCNAMSIEFFNEIHHIFTTINNQDEDIRCVILLSPFKHFSFGLDCTQSLVTNY